MGYWYIIILKYFKTCLFLESRGSCCFASELDEPTDTAVLSGLFINKNKNQTKAIGNCLALPYPHQLECTQGGDIQTQIICFLRGKWHAHRAKAYKCTFKDMSCWLLYTWQLLQWWKEPLLPAKFLLLPKAVKAPFTWSCAI